MELQQRQAELDAQAARVVLVTFGVKEGAKLWLQETNCPYDMLCDPDRKLYKAFSLKRLLSKVWHTTALMYYAEQKASGRALLQPYKDIEDDPHQMGGDFVINKEGKLNLIYRSKTPPDRPSFDQILRSFTENPTE